MHILYLQQLLVMPGSPGNSRSWEMARHWLDAGHTVTILTTEAVFPSPHDFYEAQSYPHLFQYEGIDIWVMDIAYAHKMSFPRRIISFLQFYRQARRLGEKVEDIDIVLAYSAPLSVGELGRRLALYHKTPFYFEVADVWPDVPIGMGIIRNPLLIRWLHYRTRKIYQAAKRIFTFSEGMKEQIIDHKIPKEKITVIHNGVNFQQIPNLDREARPTESVEVIYMGTIGKANGVDQLIRAAASLEEMGRKDIRWSIIGDGNDALRVKQIAATLQVQNLHFYSAIPKEEVAQKLAQADIGVISFAPYPVLEANGASKFFDYLASALPVLTNYEGWQATYLDQYQCGLAARQGDEDDFIRQLLVLADNAQLRKDMGMRGRALAAKLFDRKSLAQEMLKRMDT